MFTVRIDNSIHYWAQSKSAQRSFDISYNNKWSGRKIWTRIDEKHVHCMFSCIHKTYFSGHKGITMVKLVVIYSKELAIKKWKADP